jgi:hypothetical protein
VAKQKRPGKKGKRLARARGMPICTAMVLCGQVIVGDDKVPTLVRIIDTIGLPPRQDLVPGGIGEVGPLTLFISLRRGDSSGRFSFVLASIGPDKQRTAVGKVEYEAIGEPESGATIMGSVRVAWGGEGLYWLELSTKKGNLLARTPLKIFVGEADEVVRKIAERDAALAPAPQGPTK